MQTQTAINKPQTTWHNKTDVTLQNELFRPIQLKYVKEAYFQATATWASLLLLYFLLVAAIIHQK